MVPFVIFLFLYRDGRFQSAPILDDQPVGCDPSSQAAAAEDGYDSVSEEVRADTAPDFDIAALEFPAEGDLHARPHDEVP